MNAILRISYFSVLIFLSACIPEKKTVETANFENEIRYATNLEISKNGDQVLVHLMNPENTEIERRYCLIKNEGEIIPKGYQVIHVPIKSIIALSSTHIGMLSKIHESNRIIGVSSSKYIYDPIVKSEIKAGRVIEMGDESDIPVEAIIQSKSEMIMYSGFGKSFPHEDQLNKLGITCLANYDWRENHPLGKAEWIKLFGYLTGKEKEAQHYFDTIEKAYNITLKLAQSAKKKPTVISGNLIGDSWYAPAGESYMAHLFTDANADYIYQKTKGTGSIQRSFEQILIDNKQTDFWLNPGYSSLNELLSFQPKFSHLQTVQQKAVYCYWHKSNRFWELSAIEPQYVLSDLIRIFHPEILQEGELHFYKKLD
jgi:iron complex transport system substrate-binding protein